MNKAGSRARFTTVIPSEVEESRYTTVQQIQRDPSTSLRFAQDDIVSWS